MPFILVSWFVSSLWLREKHRSPGRSVALYSLLALLLLAMVGFPNRIPGIESRWLYQNFNSVKSTFDAFLNWTWLSKYQTIFPGLLPSKTYVMVRYDLCDLSWTLWLALFVGAPLLLKLRMDWIRPEPEQYFAPEVEVEFKYDPDARKFLERENELQRQVTDRDLEIQVLKATINDLRTALGKKPKQDDDSGGVFGSDFL